MEGPRQAKSQGPQRAEMAQTPGNQVLISELLIQRGLISLKARSYPV